MTPYELQGILAKTWDDQQLSRGERQALSTLFSTGKRLEPAMVRNAAFAHAREALGNSLEPARVLDWLEEVLKLSQPVAAATTICEVHVSPGETCPRRIVSLLDQCRTHLDICVFTITDDRLASAILAAHARRVAVRIITDNEKAFDPGSDIQRLEKAGVPVCIDCTPFHMHHKFALFDKRLLLNGSYNWTRGAAESNEENFLITGEPRLLEPYTELFESLWKRFSAK